MKLIGAEQHTYQDLANAYMALEAKQVDAVNDTAINLGEAAAQRQVPRRRPVRPAGRARPVRRDSSEGFTNVAAVNAVFKAMKDSGELKALTVRT